MSFENIVKNVHHQIGFFFLYMVTITKFELLKCHQVRGEVISKNMTSKPICGHEVLENPS